MSEKPKIAIATGDPGGIGPEISIKAALDPTVCAACNPIVVSDQAMLAQHASACGIKAELRVVEHIADADWSGPWLNVLDCPQPGAAEVAFGTSSADGGRAAIGFAHAAIKAAVGGAVDGVVAAPQNETSIALAGIKFDGHPSFVARETGTDENDVYLMLCFDHTRIVHCTLHQSVKTAIAMITGERVLGVLTAAQRALEQLGIAAPKIAVSGLNPHADEGGLFGREEIEIITPAITTAIAQGIAAAGPFGADILFHKSGFDAYVVMLHDQGHIAAKLLAPSSAAALTIGTPILFSSVAHGSAHDIAGKGIANPAAMVSALLQLSNVKKMRARESATA
jgi:4-hydroxy-L-threonine phosphate dehydrogenase PdxA